MKSNNLEEIQVPVKAPKKKKIFITEEDEPLSSSSSEPISTPKRVSGPAAVRFNTDWEAANITNFASCYIYS